MAPRLHALLEAYGRRSGIPVLLNTSFNVAGEPIVNRALEGYSTFRRCGIDVLVAGPTLVTKPAVAHRRPLDGGGRMITKRGGMRRRLIMLGSAGGSIAELAAACGAATPASAGWCRWPCSCACSAWC